MEFVLDIEVIDLPLEKEAIHTPMGTHEYYTSETIYSLDGESLEDMNPKEFKDLIMSLIKEQYGSI